MENIFKISKRGIIAILALCILLGIAGTCMDVTAMASETAATVEETAVATEEITTVVVEETTLSTEENRVATEETIPELVPVMASECCNHTYTNTSYSGGTCPTCKQSVSGTVRRCSKCGKGWVNLTCGHSLTLNN